MRDSEAELASYSSLPLHLFGAVANQFDAADLAALSYQRWHHGMTRGAATLGTAAVVLAILELAYGEILGPWTLHIEFLLALSAGAIALIGNKAAFKEKWLLQRHQAESCRLLKFRLLVRPDLWAGSGARAEHWIAAELEEIQKLQGRESLDRAANEPTRHGRFPVQPQVLPRQTLKELVEYYLGKRLNPQKEYLANRAQRNEHGVLNVLPSWLFFLSVGAVFVKYFVELLRHSRGEDLLPAGKLTPLHSLTILLAAVGAASLPVLAAGVRTFRAAFEFSRNQSRFQAAHDALSGLEECTVRDSLEALSGGGLQRETNSDVDAYAVVSDLWWCEHILESEHREWLRLMYETEWFG